MVDFTFLPIVPLLSHPLPLPVSACPTFCPVSCMHTYFRLQFSAAAAAPRLLPHPRIIRRRQVARVAVWRGRRVGDRCFLLPRSLGSLLACFRQLDNAQKNSPVSSAARPADRPGHPGDLEGEVHDPLLDNCFSSSLSHSEIQRAAPLAVNVGSSPFETKNSQPSRPREDSSWGVLG